MSSEVVAADPQYKEGIVFLQRPTKLSNCWFLINQELWAGFPNYVTADSDILTVRWKVLRILCKVKVWRNKEDTANRLSSWHIIVLLYCSHDEHCHNYKNREWCLPICTTYITLHYVCNWESAETTTLPCQHLSWVYVWSAPERHEKNPHSPLTH